MLTQNVNTRLDSSRSDSQQARSHMKSKSLYSQIKHRIEKHFHDHNDH